MITDKTRKYLLYIIKDVLQEGQLLSVIQDAYVVNYKGYTLCLKDCLIPITKIQYIFLCRSGFPSSNWGGHLIQPRPIMFKVCSSQLKQQLDIILDKNNIFYTCNYLLPERVFVSLTENKTTGRPAGTISSNLIEPEIKTGILEYLYKCRIDSYPVFACYRTLETDKITENTFDHKETIFTAFKMEGADYNSNGHIGSLTDDFKIELVSTFYNLNYNKKSNENNKLHHQPIF